MESRVQDVDYLILPIRSRVIQAPESNILAKIALADRIADLPDVHVVDHDSDGGARRVDVYLGELETVRRKQRRPTMFCNIGAHGIVVHGLADVDRHHVLCRRWGCLHRQSVLLFLPRDADELEIVWRILECAYAALVTAEVTGHPPRRALVYELPRFSRTNLQ